MSEICSVCKDVERPTCHRCNVCNNPVHNVLCATLLSDNERDTRICNACSSAKEKVRKRKLSDSAKLQEGMSKKSKSRKTVQPTLSFLLERKTRESGEKKEIGLM